MLRVNQVKVPVSHTEEQLKKKTAEMLRVIPADIRELKIIRQSIDARKKPDIFYSYSVDVSVRGEEKILRRFANKRSQVSRTEEEKYVFPKPGNRKREGAVVIAGMGPAGLFCAYFLALHGYRPIVLERGRRVEERIADVEKFWETGVLNPVSNVQFGEGGSAAFSDGKLDYAICAALAVFFSELQSKIFVSGSVMSPSLYWGFLADHATVTGVLWYLAQISGFFFIGLVVVAVFLKRSERVILGGFLLPMLFAFLISLTPDINVNHKYVMISYAFVTVFWGWVVRNIFLSGKTKWKKWSCKVACVILCICLIGTGVYDFVVILLDNDSAHRMTVDMESSLTDWLSSNLKKNDLLLTPEYTMNEVTMSGAMLYCGWPYYAWSAGRR